MFVAKAKMGPKKIEKHRNTMKMRNKNNKLAMKLGQILYPINMGEEKIESESKHRDNLEKRV